jgi:hypothetical protein
VYNLIFFLILIAGLLPSWQSLQDWARYKYINRSGSQSRKKNSFLIRDLILGEKSPTVIAIAINLGIVALIWMPWLVTYASQNLEFWYLPIALLFLANLIWMYAAIAQLIFLSKLRNYVIWFTFTVSALTILPSMTIQALTGTPANGFRMFSVFLDALFVIKDTNTATIVLSLLGQTAAIALLGLKLRQTLQHRGKSQLKIVMESKSLPGRSNLNQPLPRSSYNLK